MPWEDRIIQLRGLSITIIYRRRQISSRHDEYMADVIFSPTDRFVISRDTPSNLQESLFRTIIAAYYARTHQASSIDANQHI